MCCFCLFRYFRTRTVLLFDMQHDSLISCNYDTCNKLTKNGSYKNINVNEAVVYFLFIYLNFRAAWDSVSEYASCRTHVIFSWLGFWRMEGEMAHLMRKQCKILLTQWTTHSRWFWQTLKPFLDSILNLLSIY